MQENSREKTIKKLESGFSIVEYEDSHAESLAQLWNASGDNWGGYTSLETAETIRTKQASSVDLFVYLAVDNASSQVLGYCSFRRYELDIDTNYIPLLNVHPEFHGLGLGKALILKCLEKAIESANGRLDLFTWAGNTKAVPLYKKCGFVWEAMDESVHLMNFIPVFLNSDYLKGYFSNFDWYEDNCRNLDIEPDELEKDGMKILEYCWKKDTDYLRIQVEKRGRGIVSVESNSIAIDISLEKQKLVGGREYELTISMSIPDSTEKNAHLISYKGLNNSKIRCENNGSFELSAKKVLKIPFYLEAVKREMNNPYQCSDKIEVELTIDGKKLLLSHGIIIQQPAAIDFLYTDTMLRRGDSSRLFVNLRNNLQNAQNFQMELPENDYIDFAKPQLNIHAEPEQKVSVPLEYSVKKEGIFNQDIHVNGEFRSKLTLPIQGSANSAQGESADAYLISNGPTLIRYNIESSKNHVSFPSHCRYGQMNIMYPKLGEPYSSEFSTKGPAAIEGSGSKACFILKSSDFPGTNLLYNIEAAGDSRVKIWMELERDGDSENRKDPIKVVLPFWFARRRVIAQKAGKYIDIQGNYGQDYSNFSSEDQDERFLYIESTVQSFGMEWEEGITPLFSGWFMNFEFSFQPMRDRTRLKSPILELHLVDSWNSFERQLRVKRERSLTDLFHWDVESAIVDPDFTSSIEFFNSDEERGDLHFSDGLKDQLTGSKKSFSHTLKPGYMGMFSLNADLENFTQDFQKFIAVADREKPISIQENGNSCTADNGVVQISADGDFAFNLHSLKYKGINYLFSNYPEKGPYSWWNPFIGGMLCCFGDYEDEAISRKESARVQPAQLQDVNGREWQGIEISTTIQHMERFEGLTFKQYFLLQPGLPLMQNCIKLENNSGRYLKDILALSLSFWDLEREIGKRTVSEYREDQSEKIFKAGRGEIETGTNKLTKISAEGRDHAYVYRPAQAMSCVNNQLVYTIDPNSYSVADGDYVWTHSTWVLLTDQKFTPKDFKSLDKVSFK
jgi:ribosomal protein S18 acetylase RimI-like enzyme